MEETRKVNNDWTINYKGKLYQLKKQSQYNVPCKSIIYVRMYLDGTIEVFYRGYLIECNEIK